MSCTKSVLGRPQHIQEHCKDKVRKGCLFARSKEVKCSFCTERQTMLIWKKRERVLKEVCKHQCQEGKLDVFMLYRSQIWSCINYIQSIFIKKNFLSKGKKGSSARTGIGKDGNFHPVLKCQLNWIPFSFTSTATSRPLVCDAPCGPTFGFCSHISSRWTAIRRTSL